MFNDKVQLAMGEIPEDMQEWAMDLQKKSEEKTRFVNVMAGIRVSL